MFDIFGGLKPIFLRLFFDIVAYILLFVATFSDKRWNASILLLLTTFVLTILTAGFTGRWTLLFPMVPVILLQGCRRLVEAKWISILIAASCILLLSLSIALSVLFPAVEIPAIKGPYNVGVIDLHIPVDAEDVTSSKTLGNDDFVHVRLLYPTEETGRIKYVREKGAKEYLAESMKFGAPPAIRDYGWILHNWLLAEVTAKYHATLASDIKSMPIVIFSHGAGGVNTIYSYQTMMLAANGYFVVAIDHSDGSAPVMTQQDGSLLFLDETPARVWMEAVKLEDEDEKKKKKIASVTMRRSQTELRAKEMLGTMSAVHRLNKRDLPELKGISFINKLEVEETFVMGHSWGGATALTVGLRYPERVKAIIAHEPANDWTPPDVLRSVIPRSLEKLCPLEFDGGTGGLVKNHKTSAKASIQDVDVLMLWSHEWFRPETGWAQCLLLEWFHKNNKLTPSSQVHVIEKAQHNEFSDTCMMTPLWLARAVGITGPRNPLHTADEIHERTLSFLHRLKTKTT